MIGVHFGEQFDAGGAGGFGPMEEFAEGVVGSGAQSFCECSKKCAIKGMDVGNVTCPFSSASA